MKSLFRCPVCGGPLDREERVYRCADRHSYDIAKEGYTYLLPVNQKHSKAPGDDKAMAAARSGHVFMETRSFCVQNQIGFSIGVFPRFCKPRRHTSRGSGSPSRVTK